jgi:hypothetical protein
MGTGSFSWLLRFDVEQGTLTTGSASALPGPALPAPYAFDDKMVPVGGTTLHVAPVTLRLPWHGCPLDSSAGDVVLSVALDAAGAPELLLPLHQIRFFNGSTSRDRNCIGFYNAAGLDPAHACQPDPAHPQFLDGAEVAGYFVLAETDLVPVAPLAASLCVLLSGDAATYGDGAQPVAHCTKAPNGEILFQGDWCAAQGQPATASCHDAVQLSASFAASGVLVE